MTTREDHWRRLERLYVEAPTNAYYRPQIRVGDGTAEISLEIRPDFYHAAEAIHGSVYFKLLDDAGFFAANSQVTDVFLLTAEFTIHLLRPVSRGLLTAVGRVVSPGERQFLGEAELFDADRRLLGHGIGTYVKSQLRLDDVESARRGRTR